MQITNGGNLPELVVTDPTPLELPALSLGDENFAAGTLDDLGLFESPYARDQHEDPDTLGLFNSSNVEVHPCPTIPETSTATLSLQVDADTHNNPRASSAQHPPISGRIRNQRARPSSSPYYDLGSDSDASLDDIFPTYNLSARAQLTELADELSLPESRDETGSGYTSSDYTGSTISDLRS
eukprot:CAMPEP_0114570112 /NCGR_PEP_ID=MMETSP0114-20121206/17015_1 /TAXON_ID=31324 /ORGANISM="Goniomonas sp, Strain m" /LENGTH=181 /DNA_ID=CAMNT_0001757095 /DNA_START=1 /DNA_END=546 /DNA_ORIENTATION=-